MTQMAEIGIPEFIVRGRLQGLMDRILPESGWAHIENIDEDILVALDLAVDMGLILEGKAVYEGKDITVYCHNDGTPV